MTNLTKDVFDESFVRKVTKGEDVTTALEDKTSKPTLLSLGDLAGHSQENMRKKGGQGHRRQFTIVLPEETPSDPILHLSYSSTPA